MPLYNYQCSCGNEFESFNKIDDRALAKCEICGNLAEQTLSRRPAAVHNFKLGWFEHIAPDPVYAKSKKHLKELCNRYDCYAPGVLDQ
jgi:putative FmdB family regulatory protein